jgi:hypothetical protein
MQTNPWRAKPSNPWTGVNAWKEFLYDLRHPVDLLYRRGWPGLKEAFRDLFG